MTLPLNTDIDAMVAQSELTISGQKRSIAIQRLSAGFRINAAKDDAARLAITDGMVSQVKGLTQARRNANDGISLAQTAEAALAGTTAQLQRIRELIVMAQDSEQSQNLSATQEEISRCTAEINRISTQTLFNDLAPLGGTQDSVVFQAGAAEDQDITLALPKVDATTLGVDTLDVSSAATEDALARIDSAIDQVNSRLATLAETQGRLQSAAANPDQGTATLTTILGLRPRS